MKNRMRKIGLALAGVVMAVTLSACHGIVTPDGTSYTYNDAYTGGMIVQASATTGGNEREFFWEDTAPTEADSTVCATFTYGQGIDQQGIVLRLADTNGVYTGISITRNVIYSYFGGFNFHVWNTSAAFEASNGGNPFLQFGAADLTAYVGTPSGAAVYPLNMCARTVSSENIAQFIIWKSGDAQPAWGSTTQGGQATLPADAPTAGQGGWFAGHLVPGTTMIYTNLSVDGVVAPANSIS